MSVHGEELGADLYKLLVVAKRDLPSVSEIYQYCVSTADHVTSEVDNVMRRPAFFGGGPYGPVHEPWLALHTALRAFLAQTGSNLNDTARALDLAVTAYQATDDAAAEQLRDLCAAGGLKPDPLKVLP